jgi:O-antigen/teichoic acid export membrane protein
MSLSRRVSLNTAGQIAGRLYNSTLAFAITALILPRRLSPADFGIFAFHLTLYLLLANVLDFGAGTIVIREAARDRGGAGRLIGMLIGLKARFALAGTLLLIGVALVFEGPGARSALLAIAALHLLAHAPSGAATIFAVDMAFGRSVLAGALGQTTWLLGTLVLVLRDVREPAAYLLVFGLGPVVNGLLSYAWARRRVRIDFAATPQERRSLWNESWPAGVSMTMASVYFYIDAVMIRPLLGGAAGEVAVAHYSAAYRLMTFVLMLPVLFSQVVFPVFSRLWEAGPARVRPFFLRTTSFLAALGLLFPATIGLLQRDIMALIYPPEYVAGARSLGILSLAIVVVFCAYPHVLLLLAAGHQRLMMRISMGGAALNVALNLWWVPRLGIEGAAWATVVTEILVLSCAAVSVWRRTGVRFTPSVLLRPLLCAAGAFALLSLLLPRLDGSAVALRVGAGILVAGCGALLSGVLPLDLGEDDGGPAPVGSAP